MPPVVILHYAGCIVIHILLANQSQQEHMRTKYIMQTWMLQISVDGSEALR